MTRVIDKPTPKLRRAPQPLCQTLEHLPMRTAPRGRRSSSPAIPTRKSIPVSASRAWLILESRQENSE